MFFIKKLQKKNARNEQLFNKCFKINLKSHHLILFYFEEFRKAVSSYGLSYVVIIQYVVCYAQLENYDIFFIYVIILHVQKHDVYIIHIYWILLYVLLTPLQTQDIAIRCIQKNVRKFMGVRGWPWWRLLIKITPMLNVHRTEDMLKSKLVSSYIT